MIRKVAFIESEDAPYVAPVYAKCITDLNNAWLNNLNEADKTNAIDTVAGLGFYLIGRDKFMYLVTTHTAGLKLDQRHTTRLLLMKKTL